MSKLRLQLLRSLDRSRSLRVAATRLLAASYSRKGADRAILDEAVAGARDREAKRTAEMIMWAGAVAGVCRFPAWFTAARHIQVPENRTRSAEALARHLEQRPDAPATLWRQRFLLSEHPPLDDVRSFVERDLSSTLRAKSARPNHERETVTSDHQLAILRRAVPALEQAGLRPFLVSGSLLGIVRDGRLMEHDYDIDLGLLPDAASAAHVGDLLERAGFDVTVDDVKVVAVDESGFAVDVFLHYERDGLLWHGTSIHEWWNTPFDLVRTDIDGLQVWIPDDAERYLTENYGTWQQPIAFYHFSFDTPNRRYRQTHDALLYLHRRVVHGLQHGDRWLVESAVRELRDHFGVDVTDWLQSTPLLDPAPTDEFA